MRRGGGPASLHPHMSVASICVCQAVCVCKRGSVGLRVGCATGKPGVQAGAAPSLGGLLRAPACLQGREGEEEGEEETAFGGSADGPPRPPQRQQLWIVQQVGMSFLPVCVWTRGRSACQAGPRCQLLPRGACARSRRRLPVAPACIRSPSRRHRRRVPKR